MARKTQTLAPKAPTSEALAPAAEIQSPALDVILERLERLEESAMRDRAAMTERVQARESQIAALTARIDLLEQRIMDVAGVANDVRTQQMAIAQAEPITATLEYTTAEVPADQLAAIKHKLHLLNNSIGAY
jgi:hypothetical protein